MSTVIAKSEVPAKASSMRLYYLRDNKNLQEKKRGGQTRGDPVGLIASEVNFDTKVISYQVATLFQKRDEDYNKLGAPIVKVVRDTFVKSIGRRIATERLARKPFKINDADTSSGHEIIVQIMESIEDNAKLQYRARKLASRWLNDKSHHPTNVERS
jgi:hypothetical protein